jgi:hypothetical protein
VRIDNNRALGWRISAFHFNQEEIMRFLVHIFAAAISATAPANAQEAPESYLLFRSSLVDPVARIYIASFDAEDGESYNAENCALVADLIQRQPGTKTRFWCEPGLAE